MSKITACYYLPHVSQSTVAVGRDFKLDRTLGLHVHVSGIFDLTTPAGMKAFEDTGAKLLTKQTIYQWVPRPKIIIEAPAEAQPQASCPDCSRAHTTIVTTPAGELATPIQAPSAPQEVTLPPPVPVETPSLPPAVDTESPAAEDTAAPASDPPSPYEVLAVEDKFVICRHAEGLADKFRGKEDFWADTAEDAAKDGFATAPAAKGAITKLTKKG